MTVETIKAEKVVSTSLGLLERAVVLPRLVWRDAGIADVKGAKGDTITVKLPAYGKANKRTLRSGSSRSKSALYERSVDVKLKTDIYMDVPISDEVLTLDISDFGAQVLNPVLAGVARGLEDEIAAVINGASYDRTVPLNLGNLKKSVADARELLNKADVPANGRTLLIGTSVENNFIQLDNFVRVDQSGASDTLREAIIGRVYGFDVVVSNLIDPDAAYAFHQTAFAMTTRAPIVPAGAPWGASNTHAGFSIRTVRVFDPEEVEDRFVADSWIGVGIVTDSGTLDGKGRFIPAEDPEDSGESDLFVRAVKLVPAGGSSSSSSSSSSSI